MYDYLQGSQTIAFSHCAHADCLHGVTRKKKLQKNGKEEEKLSFSSFYITFRKPWFTCFSSPFIFLGSLVCLEGTYHFSSSFIFLNHRILFASNFFSFISVHKELHVLLSFFLLAGVNGATTSPKIQSKNC